MLFVAYLGDTYIVCDHWDVVESVICARDNLRDVCHIDINVGKLVVWSKVVCDPPNGFVDLFGTSAWKANAPNVSRGIKILGAPFGTEQYNEQFFSTVLEKEAKLLNFLPQLPSIQSAWLLLYFWAVPKNSAPRSCAKPGFAS